MLTIAALAAACDRGPAPSPELPPATHYATVAEAILAIVPADARVLGVGELHERSDRTTRARQPALAWFAHDVFPALAPRLSDLVLETWVVDPACQAAAPATARIEAAMARPAATKSALGQLVESARQAGVQPRAMQLGCADWKAVAPQDGDVDAAALLDITTAQLTRVTTAALAKPGGRGPGRTMIAVYGGALHNDRFPYASVKVWSYAAAVDAAAAGHYIELDLVVPEYAELDPLSAREPWFALVAAQRDQVTVWQRGERSFIVLLPRS